MKKGIFLRTGWFIISVLLVIISAAEITAQESQNSPSHIYRPGKTKPDQTKATDTVSMKVTGRAPDTTRNLINSDYQPDTLNAQSQYILDSLRKREAFVRDSILVREAFVRDSILAREAFIRDSIAERQRIIDSLTLFTTQLPRLLDASQKAISDDIIFRQTPIVIVGDSTLSNYTTYNLTFDFTSAYTPWKSSMNLSDKPPKFTFDKPQGKIIGIESPQFTCNYEYSKNGMVLVIRTKSSVLSKRTGKLYKEPIDSVFFDRQGNVIKVKKYIQYYSVVNNFQRGSKLFAHNAYVKQYQYSPAGQMTSFELVKFCDRWKATDPVKVCNITNYTITPSGNTYQITRQNNPSNDYSDGTFTYVFNPPDVLESVSFTNKKGTENWKNIIEVNEAGHVSRYLYEKNGRINQTLLVNYNTDDPKAKYKVETISCSFEDDGISYFQKNNMTGKHRIRDRLTMEWSPWQD